MALDKLKIHIGYCIRITLLLMFFGSSVSAQTINKLSLPNRQYEVNAAARISVEFKSEGAPRCGLVVDWGDGRTQSIRVGHDGEEGAPSSPFIIENVYKSPGRYNVKVKGEYLRRGLGSVNGCVVESSSIDVIVIDPIQERKNIGEGWRRYLADLQPIENRCIEIGSKKRNIKFNPNGPDELTPINESNVQQLLAQCKKFVSQKQPQGITACKFQTPTGIVDSLCEGLYVDDSDNGIQKSITLDQAISNHLTGLNWKFIQIENQIAKENRQAAEKAKLEKAALDQKAEAQRTADAEIARKAAEEKERIWKLSPDYKRQQAEADKKRISEEKEAAAAEARARVEALERSRREDAEKLAIAKREAIENQAKRLAEEKEREVLNRRQKYESSFIRPMMSASDPRINCLIVIHMDPRFVQLSEKISLSGLTNLSFPMLADKTIPTANDRKLIALMAEEVKHCVNESANFRKNNYAKAVLDILEKEDASFLDAAMDLYSNKTSFGVYNLSIQQAAKDSLNRLQALEIQTQKQKIEQEEAARVRAAAMEEAARLRAATLKEAQLRQEQQRRDQEQQRQAESRRQDQIRQAEQERIAGVRRQWSARCEFDRRNAYEKYKKAKENDCNVNSAGLAVLCVFAVASQADDYGKAAFDSCMSGAPN